MKSGFDMFSDNDIAVLFAKDLKVEDDDDWRTDFMSSPLKKQDWDFKDFMEELEKQIEDGKTFEELAKLFWV